MAALFESPPEWLLAQLKRCREDEGIIKPMCSTLAYEVFGTASRWEEVEPAVERWLAGGAA